MDNPRLLRRAILIGAILLLLAQTLATLAIVDRAKESQIAAAQATVERTALAIEASINRAFVQVDAMLAGLPALLAHLAPTERMERAVVNQVLQQLNNQNFTYRDILLIGEDGMPIATALPISRRRPLPLSLETGFAELVERGGGVSIGGPVQNPSTGEWTLFFARRLTLEGLGSVFAVAEVPVPAVRSLLAAAGESDSLRTTLERDDGVLLASAPHDEARIGQPLHPPASRLGERAATAPAVSRFDGALVFIAVRPTLYPTLFVTASITLEAALANWQRDRERAFLTSLAIGIVIIFVAFALVAILRQREQAEAERAKALRTLENALEAMSEGFVMFDADDRLIACNSRYKDFYRLSAPFIVPGARFEDIIREGAKRGQYPQAGEDIEAFVAAMKEFHRGNQPPMERFLPDGRWVLITERRTPDGGTVGIRTDITALKRAMQELAAARDAAAAAVEAKSRFLARVSHELRTPLNGVLGFAQVLLSDPRLQPDQREQVKTLYDAGRYLLELVNGLLDLSKIEAGRLDLTPRPVALRSLLEGCANLLSPEIARKNIAFHCTIDPSLPAAAELDPLRFRQILLNLLSNAAKFTPAGGRIDLRLRCLATDRLRIEVQDNGPGIPADKRSLLFEDFVQITSQIGEEPAGTGLGLAITARLVALMGGEIGYQEPAGGGSLFWVELPLRPVAAPAEETTAAPPAEEQKAERPLRLLVVDDIAANRDIARAMLNSAGHYVEVAEDGAAALLALANGGFDAVLMDLEMPTMDGFEATRRIRALPPPLCDVPVIAFTASALPEQIEATRRAGMSGHIVKPLDRNVLLAVLRDVPHGKAAFAPSSPSPPVTYLDEKAIATLEKELGSVAPGIFAEFVGEIRRAQTLLVSAAAAEKSEAREVQHAAHRMLGAARTLGATRLAEEAEALERAARSGDVAPDLQAAILATASTTLAALEQRLGLATGRSAAKSPRPGELPGSASVSPAAAEGQNPTPSPP